VPHRSERRWRCRITEGSVCQCASAVRYRRLSPWPRAVLLLAWPAPSCVVAACFRSPATAAEARRRLWHAVALPHLSAASSACACSRRTGRWVAPASVN
jgi:hypothetical protein